MLNAVDLVGREVELVLLAPPVQSPMSITRSACRDAFRRWWAEPDGRDSMTVHSSSVNIDIKYIFYPLQA